MSEHTKIVTALLTLVYTVLPIRRIGIAGVVGRPPRSCASATLTLTRISPCRRLELKGRLSKTPGQLIAADYLQLADLGRPGAVRGRSR